MIGIYGGTFDPIHYGHLRTALEAKEILGLDQLRLVPCQIPPHRATPGATPAQRLALLEAALADAEPGFRIDTRELERPGPSYMVDTLESIRAEIGDTEPLCLIAGLDAFLQLHRWHRWRDLPGLAHIAVLRRPGAAPDFPAELRTWLDRRLASDPGALRTRACGKIHFIEVSQLEISATRIRAALAQGLSARYLLPDAVLRSIQTLGLYRPPAA
ncbi:nicotinate-nucleotide adenylyltransferase [Methylomagnum ishizawai]|uniref:Probable nicotinate-nucleotide adenylyltransferase n=1 Tax=Methylomagnum ishizawai TaxID=1760988 RepID=A0A1Y6CTT9_9GAMM|nr:nicotinate-nucleotide adenylyltransferase [Methylomagnum ishizawai]SMF94048.1 nicotinate-nucleotide adenylyltransferase [Methylomagnum ishizawai]